MATSASPSQKQWRILCIDDDPDILFILEASLGIQHEVITAHDGMEAISMLDACDADFIICDVRMPEMDGFQTVQAIRSHPDYAQTPVFFLTAETDKEMAKRGYAAGGNLYLTKPFDPMRLMKNIEYFLKENAQKPRPKRLAAEMVAQAKKSPQAAVPASAPPKVAPAGQPKPRVIIICANPTQLDHLHGALSHTFESIPCADPLESLQRLFRYEPDMLVINPIMPKISGWGLAQMIRRTPRLNPVPIILVDGRTQQIEPNLVATITKQPLLPASSTPAEIIAAVTRATNTPGFVVHEKKVSIADLVSEEETLRTQMRKEQDRLLREENSRRERFRKIQEFIDTERA